MCVFCRPPRPGLHLGDVWRAAKMGNNHPHGYGERVPPLPRGLVAPLELGWFVNKLCTSPVLPSPSASGEPKGAAACLLRRQ